MPPWQMHFSKYQNLTFILYFTTIEKQVLPISLIGTGVSARGSIALTLSGNTFALIGFVMF